VVPKVMIHRCLGGRNRRGGSRGVRWGWQEVSGVA